MTADRRTDPLVSVILPFYNAPFLRQSVESILNQTYENFELLLINNGSSDASVKVAESFEHHPKVTLIEEPRRGVVHAANTGIRQSKGVYVARMDADDISKPDRLSLQVEMLQKNPNLGVASGHVEYIGNAEQNQGFVHYMNWLNSITSEQEIVLNRFIEFPLANPTLMFRRELFDTVGPFRDGDFPEDYELFLRMMEQGVRFGKVPVSILQWRDSPHRLTRSDPRYARQAFFEIKSKYLAHWLQENNPYHPEIWVWGAGRLSRRRSDLLKVYGVEIVQYIDFKEGKSTIQYERIPAPGNCFICSFVANRGAREEIRSFLKQRGYQEGINFILAS